VHCTSRLVLLSLATLTIRWHHVRSARCIEKIVHPLSPWSSLGRPEPIASTPCVLTCGHRVRYPHLASVGYLPSATSYAPPDAHPSPSPSRHGRAIEAFSTCQHPSITDSTRYNSLLPRFAHRFSSDVCSTSRARSGTPHSDYQFSAAPLSSAPLITENAVVGLIAVRHRQSLPTGEDPQDPRYFWPALRSIQLPYLWIPLAQP
jgi:hypothetical protein